MSTLGDIATIAAPTVVAVAAIGASTLQQSRSRAFDRAEREKERRHDREMREAAERHERTLSDLDYQRKLVDDVTEALEDARDALVSLFVHWDDRTGDVISRVSTVGDRLKVVNARMVLRFGPDHEAVSIIARACKLMDQAWLAGIYVGARKTDEEKAMQRTRVSDAVRGVRDAFEAFLSVTGGIVGSAPERD